MDDNKKVGYKTVTMPTKKLLALKKVAVELSISALKQLLHLVSGIFSMPAMGAISEV